MSDNVKINEELSDSELDIVSGGAGESSENGGKHYNVGDRITIGYTRVNPITEVNEDVTVTKVIDNGNGSYRYEVITRKGNIMTAPSRGCWLVE